jgi:excisionase family DNA binding protein
MSEISHISTQEQIKIIRQRKKEYLLKLSTKDIPSNNFDEYCDKQIKILEDQLKESGDIELEILPMEEGEIEKKSENETQYTDLDKPKLTLPDILQNQEMGGVKYAAEITKYSESHIRFLARNRKIPCYKPTKTGHWRFEYSDLQDWMKNGMKNFQTEDDTLLRRKK